MISSRRGPSPPPRLGERICADVALVGEIDGGLRQPRAFDQARPPSLVEPRQGSAGLSSAWRRCASRFGVDQVGQALDLGEIELAVEESPARELSRLGEAAARHFAERIERGSDDGAAAVKLKFGQILARLARRAGEPEHDGPVDRLAGVGPLSVRSATCSGAGTGAAIRSIT